ncbi:MAG: hypothetical protein ABSA02_00900 [Trebonia sp.]
MTADSVRHSVGERSHDDAPSPDSRRLPPSVKRRAAWLDWLDSTDPGLMRLRMATEVVVAIGAVVLAEWIFIRGTGALQVPIPHGAPAAAAAELWTLNHALLVIGIMLGAILAMISGFGVGMYANARAQLITLLFLPLPLLGMLAIGLSLHVRVLSLALLAVTLAIGTYCRRFGPRGFMGGMLAFMGAFLGFFIQQYVPLGEFGWLAAEIALGAAVTIVIHFAFFLPRSASAVRRMQRSYAARAREVANDIADLFEATVRSGKNGNSNPKADRQLQRQLLRLNEAALLIDAQLNAPAAVPAGWSAATLHQRLFDAEVGLGNVARFALEIARRDYPAQVNALVSDALGASATRTSPLSSTPSRVSGGFSKTGLRNGPGLPRTAACSCTVSPRRSLTSPSRCGRSGCTRAARHPTTAPTASSPPRWRRSAAGCPARPSSRAPRPRSAAARGCGSGSGSHRTRGPRSRWASRSASRSSRATPCPGGGSTGR